MLGCRRRLPVQGHTGVVLRAAEMVEDTTPRQIVRGDCILPDRCQYRDKECFGQLKRSREKCHGSRDG